MAKGKSTIEILVESRDEIKPKTWVCGDLQTTQLVQKGKTEEVKHMACALGLVSLAAGATTKTKFKLWSGLEGKQKTYTVDFATYPSGKDVKKWTLAAIKALAYLTLAKPEVDNYLERFYANGEGDGLSSHELARQILAAKKKPDDAALNYLSDQVTGYNDGSCYTHTHARAWFNRALKLARKDSTSSAASAS